MAAAIGIRPDDTAADLRLFARRSGDAGQVRRLLAVALILDGGSRRDAAKLAGVTLRIVRDWVLRFNESGPDGLATRKAPGRASILNDEQRARLVAVVEAGPIPAAHGVVRWRLADLAQWIWDELALSVTHHTLGRELRAMGDRKLSARPRHHGQQPDDIADFKKAGRFEELLEIGGVRWFHRKGKRWRRTWLVSRASSIWAIVMRRFQQPVIHWNGCRRWWISSCSAGR